MSESHAFNMDCMEALKEFPDGFFELRIADPPYGINVTGRHKVKGNTSPLVGGGAELSAVTGGYGRGRPAPFVMGGGYRWQLSKAKASPQNPI